MIVGVGKNPCDVKDMICLKKVLGILSEPQTNSANTFSANIWIKVPISVDEDAAR
jgi:hypothetical protein